MDGTGRELADLIRADNSIEKLHMHARIRRPDDDQRVERRGGEGRDDRQTETDENGD